MLASFPLPAWAWTLLTILAALGYWVPPLLAPLVCQVRPLKAFESAASPTSRWKGVAFSLLVGAAAVAIQYEATLPKRAWDKCHESYFSEAALMAKNHMFPMVGEFMGELTTHLGPYFYYLLNAYQLISPSPLMLFWSILIGFGLSCALIERLGRRLFGQPWGAMAVLLLATSPRLVRTFFEPAHGGLVPLQLAAFAWCVVAVFQTARPAPLILASWCLAVASQMHGITVLLLIGTVVAVVLVRPKVPWWSWLAAAAVWLLAYATWLRHYISVKFYDFFHMGTPHAYFDQSQTRLTLLGAEFGGPLAIIGVGGLGLLAWLAFRKRADDPDRPLWRAVFAFLFVSNAICMKSYGQWEARYDLSFYPFATLLTVGVLALLWQQGWRVVRASPVGPRAAGGAALAAVVLLPVIAVGQRVTGPLFGRGFGPLSFDEQREVAEKLYGSGFSVDDILWRVHGTHWNPPGTARAYLAMNALPGKRDGDERDVYVVSNCRRVEATFSSAQTVLLPLERPITIAPYKPRLAIDHFHVTTAAGIPWEDSSLFPITEEWGLTGQEWNLARLYEPIAPSARRQAFFELWRKEPASQLHVHGTFAPGPDERLLVVSGYGKRPVGVRIDGEPAKPVVENSPGDEYSLYFRMSNHERPADIKVTLDNANRPTPIFTDIYEAPMPLCTDYTGSDPDITKLQRLVAGH